MSRYKRAPLFARELNQKARDLADRALLTDTIAHLNRERENRKRLSLLARLDAGMTETDKWLSAALFVLAFAVIAYCGAFWLQVLQDALR